jgi:DNA repair protein RecN (Recombination protein N)
VSDGAKVPVLLELHVADLGVIEKLTIRPGPAMTAVTGETGAGKTMVVGAIALLSGGRADAGMVRTGASEAVIDGRFLLDGEEVVLSRVVPAAGRSRAYRNGRPISITELAQLGGSLVEIHGQHAHQELLGAGAQRAALDAFAGIDTSPLRALRRRVRELEAALDDSGGDERSRARELDLVRFQLAELDDARLEDPDEDDRLRAAEEVLADVGALREAGAHVVAELGDEGAARDRVAAALAALGDRSTYADIAVRLRTLLPELDEVIAEVRSRAAGLDDDPARLDDIQQRRRLLSDLRRKYGASLAEVIEEREVLRRRLADLEGLDGRRSVLEAELHDVRQALAAEAATVRAARVAAAPRLAEAIGDHLGSLGMPQAVVEVGVEDTAGAGGSTTPKDGGNDAAGDAVMFRLAANPGSPPQPLARVASGGELSRTMLALRLVLSGGPPVAVFDEVDAGIGGEAANRVAEALARVGEERQVLVVTHLAQVAARASTHVVIEKRVDPAGAVAGATSTTAREVDPAGRVAEVARMLSGSPDSEAAQRHAAELLAGAPIRSS